MGIVGRFIPAGVDSDSLLLLAHCALGLILVLLCAFVGWLRQFSEQACRSSRAPGMARLS